MRSVAIVVTLSVLVLALSSVQPGAATASSNEQLILVMDVGSSGTRMHAFTYTPASGNQAPPKASIPTPHPEWVLRITPGASSFVSNPAGLTNYLNPLFKFAREIAANNSFVVSQIPIVAAATSGFRLLSINDRALIFNALDSAVQNSGFRYTPGNVRVVSGTEEGLLSFLSANILAKTITESTELPLTYEDTVGSMDFGGGSQQVAFQPSSTILNNEFTFRYRQSTVQLYSNGFLQYGQDTFDTMLNNAIVKNIPIGVVSPTEVTSGCYNTGYVFNHVYNGNTYRITGNGDAASCRPIIDSLIASSDCPYSKCSIKGGYTPAFPSGQTVYASSSWYFLVSSLAITSPRPTLNDIVTATATACAYTFDALPANGHNRKQRICYQGYLLTALLHNAYGFPMDTQQIVFTNSINGADISFPIGLAFYEINKQDVGCAASPPDSGVPSSGSSSTVNINFAGIFNGLHIAN